jgi:heptosyltransferase-2
MAESSAAPRRVVVRAPNWLGDAVLALPAAGAIRRHFSDAHLTIAATAGVAPLFRQRTAAAPDEILILPGSKRAAVRMLRDGHFDLVVLFPNSIGSAWQARRAGIAQRWGMSNGVRGLLLTRQSARPRVRGLHQSDYYRALVRGLGIECDDAPPQIAVTAESLAEADALLQRARVPAGERLIGVAPGAAYGQAKQWPTARMADAIARALQATGGWAAIVGAAHDRTAGREIESWLRAHAPAVAPRVVDLIGRTSLDALAGVIARCGVFVSNDSGAMHLAAGLGRPVVAIFGPTDERATRPLGSHEVMTAAAFCRPCMLRDCPIDHRCMTRIPPERVAAAIVARATAPGRST